MEKLHQYKTNINIINTYMKNEDRFFFILTNIFFVQDKYKLILYSNFSMKTTFNFYAGIWGNWIMKDIQNNILKVIKERSENR